MKIEKLAILHYQNIMEITDEQIQSIQDALPETEIIFVCGGMQEGAKPLAEIINDVDVLITWGMVTEGLEDFCKNAPSLKWIHLFTVGVDDFMASELADLDLQVTISTGVAGYAISDHVLALIYSFTRDIPKFMDLQRKKINGARAGINFVYDEVAYKTVGIIGLGSIGRMIAEKCKRADMRVVAADLIPDKNGLVDQWYPMSEMDTLLAESDFVVLTLPLTPETQHMIGKKEFKTMKESAYLINVARGGIVDTEAFVNAIRNNEIAGAGLDVLENENNLPEDHPIWTLPNVIFTPHVSALSPQYMGRAMQLAKESLIKYANDEEVPYRVK